MSVFPIYVSSCLWFTNGTKKIVPEVVTKDWERKNNWEGETSWEEWVKVGAVPKCVCTVNAKYLRQDHSWRTAMHLVPVLGLQGWSSSKQLWFSVFNMVYGCFCGRDGAASTHDGRQKGEGMNAVWNLLLLPYLVLNGGALVKWLPQKVLPLPTPQDYHVDNAWILERAHSNQECVWFLTLNQYLAAILQLTIATSKAIYIYIHTHMYIYLHIYCIYMSHLFTTAEIEWDISMGYYCHLYIFLFLQVMLLLKISTPVIPIPV